MGGIKNYNLGGLPTSPIKKPSTKTLSEEKSAGKTEMKKPASTATYTINKLNTNNNDSLHLQLTIHNSEKIYAYSLLYTTIEAPESSRMPSATILVKEDALLY